MDSVPKFPIINAVVAEGASALVESGHDFAFCINIYEIRTNDLWELRLKVLEQWAMLDDM